MSLSNRARPCGKEAGEDCVRELEEELGCTAGSDDKPEQAFGRASRIISGKCSRLRDVYDACLSARPRLTNCCISMFISAFADTVAQVMEHATSHTPWDGLDFRRMRALALTSAFYNGFVLTSWLLALGRSIPTTDIRSSLTKLAATQAFLQPFVYVPLFFVVHGSLMGQSPGEIYSRLTTDYFALLFRLWSLFMPTRLMMFVFVPLRYQVLWDSSVSFFWQVALSLFDAGRRGTESQGLVSAMMEFQAFGYMEARQPRAGKPFPRAFVLG